MATEKKNENENVNENEMQKKRRNGSKVFISSFSLHSGFFFHHCKKDRAGDNITTSFIRRGKKNVIPFILHSLIPHAKKRRKYGGKIRAYIKRWMEFTRFWHNLNVKFGFHKHNNNVYNLNMCQYKAIDLFDKFTLGMAVKMRDFFFVCNFVEYMKYPSWCVPKLYYINCGVL